MIYAMYTHLNTLNIVFVKPYLKRLNFQNAVRNESKIVLSSIHLNQLSLLME